MVGGQTKLDLLQGSRGLVFPVRWHEPFGLAVIESLYFGSPVFATPYGALPELVPPECGLLSNEGAVLAQALTRSFDRQACHERAVTQFSAQRMAQDYLHIYRQLMQGQTLNATHPCMTEPASPLPWHKHRA